MVQTNQKQLVINMLIRSFQTSDRILSLSRSSHRKHLETFFNYTYVFARQIGHVFVSPSKNNVILYFQKSKKQHTILSLIALLRLILFGISWRKMLQIIKTQKTINSIRNTAAKTMGDSDYIYIWFLARGEKAGGFLELLEPMKHLKIQSKKLKLPLYLETTVPRMVPIYQKAGYQFYNSTTINDLTIWFGKNDNYEK